MADSKRVFKNEKEREEYFNNPETRNKIKNKITQKK